MLWGCGGPSGERRSRWSAASITGSARFSGRTSRESGSGAPLKRQQPVSNCERGCRRAWKYSEANRHGRRSSRWKWRSRPARAQLSYDSEVRRESATRGQILHKALWLVQVKVLGTAWEPWWLVTDWPVESAAEAE